MKSRDRSSLYRVRDADPPAQCKQPAAPKGAAGPAEYIISAESSFRQIVLPQSGQLSPVFAPPQSTL